MERHDWPAEAFEAHRETLRGIAYRMLGSLSEADDAVQEAWLRFGRSDTQGIENLGAWLRTVIAHVSLDMLRARAARREDPLDASVIDAPSLAEPSTSPEDEAMLADAVGLALLVVLDRLTPAERVAFVLHDLFAVPFDEIAPIVGRSVVATKKLASRARHRVRDATPISDADLAHRWHIVNVFLNAARQGDLNGLLRLLDPNVVRRADAAALRRHAPTELRGARAVADGILVFSRQARRAQMALIDGRPGLVVSRNRRVWLAMRFTIKDEKIIEIDVVASPERLLDLAIAVPNREVATPS